VGGEKGGGRWCVIGGFFRRVVQKKKSGEADVKEKFELLGHFYWERCQ